MIEQAESIKDLDNCRQDWLDGAGLSHCGVERIIKNIYKSIGTCEKCEHSKMKRLEPLNPNDYSAWAPFCNKLAVVTKPGWYCGDFKLKEKE